MEDINTIIQGGAVGICVLLIILVFVLVKMVFKIATNHLNHNTVAIEENTKMLGVIGEVINNSIKSDSQVLKTCERINEKIDKL